VQLKALKRDVAIFEQDLSMLALKVVNYNKRLVRLSKRLKELEAKYEKNKT